MAETISSQTKEMTTEEYASELEKQRREISKQRFPTRTLRAQQETFKGVPSGKISSMKESFVGKRTMALGKVTTEEKRVASEIETELQKAGTLQNYEKYYSQQPENFRKYIKSPTEKRQELQSEVSKVKKEIEAAQKRLEQAQIMRGKAETAEREHAAEEDIRYEKELIKRLSEGSGRVEGGQFLTASQIKSYAKGYALFEKQRLQSLNEASEAGLTEIKESGVLKGFADLSSFGVTQKKISVKQLEQKGISTIKDNGNISGFEFKEPNLTVSTFSTSEIAPTELLGVTEKSQVLKTSESSIIDGFQSDVSARNDRGIFGKVWSSITGAATRVVGGKEDREKGKEIFSPTFGTVSAKQELVKTNILTAPEIREVPTGEFVSGTEVPVTKLQYFPSVFESSLEPRKVTAKEEAFFREQTNILTPVDQTLKQKVSAKTFEAQEFLGIDVSREQRKKEIIDKDWLRTGIEKSIPGESKFEKGVSGFITGLIPSTGGEILGTAATFGIGAGVGVGIKGASLAASKVPRIGGALSSGIKGSAYLGGTLLTGAYIFETGKAVKVAEGPKEKGEIIGESTREFAAFGAGAKAGSKGFDIFRSRISTIGRTEIPIERLVPEEVLSGKKSFPEAPKKEQFRLFKETAERFPEFSEGRPGAFHTTPNQFWRGGKLVPTEGKSELPGLYASSDVSIYFSRLGGKGSSIRLFPRLSEIFTPEGKPGIAFLQPKRFRINPFTGEPRKPIIKGGERVKEFADFKEPAEPGAADIPLMKREIESVFRPGTGEYYKVSGNYYTTYNGVRIPLDVLRYREGTGKVGDKAPKLRQGAISEYSLPSSTEYSIIEPRAGYSIYGSKSSISPVSSVSFSKLSSSSYSSKPSTSSQIKSSVSRISSIYSKNISSQKSSVPSTISYSPTPSNTYSSVISSPSSYNLFRGKKPKKEKKKRIIDKRKEKDPFFIKQRVGYIPSFTAAALNIRGKRTKKILGGKSETFGIRPILDIKL